MTRERWQGSKAVDAAWGVVERDPSRANVLALCEAVAACVDASPSETTGGEVRSDPCHACGQEAMLVKERRTMQWGGAREGERPFFHEADAEYWRCASCGEEWYTAKQSARLDSQLLHAITKEWRKLADAAPPARDGVPRVTELEIEELDERLANANPIYRKTILDCVSYCATRQPTNKEG